MIKIDLAAESKELQIKGPEPLIYVEAGRILGTLHELFMENNGKQYADTLIKQLCENAMLSPEERIKKWKEKKETRPAAAAFTEEMYEKLFGGKTHGK